MAAGDLDPSFGAGGKVVSDLTLYSDDVKEIAVAPDGGIVVLTNNTQSFLLKYRPDGTLDPTFGTGGRAASTNIDTHAAARTMIVAGDGRLLFAGIRYNGNSGALGSKALVMRYTADGRPDPAFDADGAQYLSAGTRDASFSALAVQPDGKIVAAGQAGGVGSTGSGSGNWLVARFNPDGSPDTTFSGDGWVVIPYFDSDDNNDANGVAVAADGRIVVTGRVYQYNAGAYTGIGVARLTPDGTLDPTFDGDGRAVLNWSLSGTNAGNEIAVRGDKILVSGSINNRPALYRLNPNGSPDTTFGGGDGLFTHPSTSLTGSADMAVLPDGRVVLAGTVSTGTGFLAGDLAVVMVREDGTAETGFGNGGIAAADFGGGEGTKTVAVQRDGKVLAAGRKLFGNDMVDIVLARFEGLARPPTVTGVFVSGAGWADEFKQYLSDTGLGDAALGYRAWDNTDRPTLRSTLPWVNLNRLSVRFSGDAAVVREALSARGTNQSTYAFAPGHDGFEYDAVTHTGTWTFAQALTKDRVVLALDVQSLSGGPFQLRLDVLPGDVDDSGSVVASDFSDVKRRFFRRAGAPGPAGDTQYSPFSDVDGSAAILAADFSEVKKRFFDTLPPAPADAGPAVSAKLRTLLD
jgi:uncharacterized delta-60 repeat protein